MKPRFTQDSWRKEPTFRSLISAMRSCKTETDLENFMRDIATLSELQAMSERLDVAKLIAKGLSYRQVAAKTGASTTTVTRVAHFLENGEGGYRLVLNTHRHHRLKNGKMYRDEPEKIERPEQMQQDSMKPLQVHEESKQQPISHDIEPLEKDGPSHVSALQKYLQR